MLTINEFYGASVTIQICLAFNYDLHIETYNCALKKTARLLLGDSLKKNITYLRVLIFLF